MVKSVSIYRYLLKRLLMPKKVSLRFAVLHFAFSLVFASAMSLLSFSSYAGDDVETTKSDEQQSDAVVWAFSAGSNSEEATYSIPREELQSHTIDVLGRPLHFIEAYKDRDKGPKPLIVFVHGTPGGWGDQIGFITNEFMRKHFHMIAVDRLGHGRSTGKIESSLQAQAVSLKPLLDRDTTGEGAILVGHSLGGPIIARTAMDFPEHVSGLVFVASSGDPKRSRRWYNTVGGIPPICWLLPKQLARSNREILPLKKELKAMLPLWQTIKVPTTIMQGGKDTLVKPANANFIQNALVNAKVKMVIQPQSDHFLHWREPQALVDVLAEFIAL